ncbi:cobalt-precorrin-5B (C(1))-methyltransferase [Algicella marina]|uniref:Cobalt-precorrin-5B C(1)-methyltransferase n=1 Tax=Algicella marina TaxID=2683284 RepID=A0A6P1T2N7_9RHOB|nr:cobalt-precorrin-5B (C(1))-methyltransferase [Algicella marina]QHQ35726.1 cobalt-precorrin-5B (C(1))-methyltransferase [Algicella marina]
MTRKPDGDLRTGFTTGACATAAAKAAAGALLSGRFEPSVQITLPRGQTPVFELAETALGEGWARAVVQKDAGDDPDVTHGAMIVVTIRRSAGGILFRAGEGVGVVTRPGLPISPGEPAINPVPRQMMAGVLEEVAAAAGLAADFEVEVSVPGGADLAKQTWNPRLGIEGGISILGTTGIVRPFSCAAWIASIHRGIDVARAAGLTHVAGATGATSERVAQAYFGLPDHAMLDMGDFAGGMLKYLARHPVERVSIVGGFGKLTKLAQGAMDLHSGRSQVNFATLAVMAEGLAEREVIAAANTAKEALEIAGPELAVRVAMAAQEVAQAVVSESALDVMVVDRGGRAIAFADGNERRAL